MKKLSALFSRSALRLAILVGMSLAVFVLGAATVGRLPTEGARQTLKLPLGEAASFVGYSPDGELIATLGAKSQHTQWSDQSRDGPVRLWDPRTGQMVLQFAGDCKSIDSVGLSPDKRTLATHQSDGSSTALWDAATGQLRGTLKGYVRFAPDGQTAVVNWDSCLELWDVPSWTRRTTIRWPGCFVFAPDGKTIAVASQDTYRLRPEGKIHEPRVVTIWDVVTGQVRSRIELKFGQIMWMRFSPDAQELEMQCMGEEHGRWNIATGEVHRDSLPFELHDEEHGQAFGGSRGQDRPWLADPRFKKFERPPFGMGYSVEGVADDLQTVAVLKIPMEYFEMRGLSAGLKPGAPPIEVHLLDVDTLRVIGRVVMPPNNKTYSFAPNGRSLAFVGREELVVWALPPRPPWWKPFALAAIPAGLVLLVGLGWELSPVFWRRLRPGRIGKVGTP